MKTITTTTEVYKFAELSESAQQNAIEKLWDFNVTGQWWEYTYDDAKQIGLEINSFDIDRGSYCKGQFLASAPECADLIIAGHGETRETYKTAKLFLADYDKLVEKYSDGKDLSRVSYDNDNEFDSDADELEGEFLKDILEDYRIILSNEYDYLTSNASIIDTINANDYDFTVDGEMY